MEYNKKLTFIEHDYSIGEESILSITVYYKDVLIGNIDKVYFRLSGEYEWAFDMVGKIYLGYDSLAEITNKLLELNRGEANNEK